MSKRPITKLLLSALLAGIAGWVSVPSVANAVNPDGSFFFGPFLDQPRQASTGAPAFKFVNYRAKINGTGCFLDLTSSSASTAYRTEAIVKCTGIPSEIPFEENTSPVTSIDDLNYFCPAFSDGEGMQWGVLIH